MGTPILGNLHLDLGQLSKRLTAQHCVLLAEGASGTPRGPFFDTRGAEAMMAAGDLAAEVWLLTLIVKPMGISKRVHGFRKNLQETL